MDDEAAAQAPEGEPAPRLRSSRRIAIVAFLLAATSLLLAWWRVTWSSGGSAFRDDVRLFRPEEPLTTSWGPWLTGGLVAAALVLLFVRIAARSERHEPASWRRDLGVAAVLLLLALASCLLWPADVPSFWGGFSYHDQNVTSGVDRVTAVAAPALGWWLAAAAALLSGWARLLARPATEK